MEGQQSYSWKDRTRATNGGKAKWLLLLLQGLRCPGGVPCLVPGGWNRRQVVCRDCIGEWGRCLVAGLEMTEQPVCPGCQSGLRLWGRGVQHVFSKPWMFSSLLFCSEAVNLPNGSREPLAWRQAGSGPGDLMDPFLSPDPATNPFQWGGALWAAGCA